MKEYQYYLFDFDGTLFDTFDALVPVYEYGFKAIGMTCTREECSKFMHLSLSQTAALKVIPEEKIKSFFEGIIEGLRLPEADYLIKNYPETFDVVSLLKKKGKKVGIVSGNCEFHMESALIFKKMNGFFDCQIGNESYSKPKPNAEPILKGLEALKCLEKDKAVYIGDSLQDVEAARGAGIDGILIDRENKHPDFKGIKITNLAELINIS